MLALAGERERRWLLQRLRSHGLVRNEPLEIAEVADAVTVLDLRKRGVKFREAIDATVAGPAGNEVATARYGGVWSRLTMVALEGIRQMLPERLLAAALAALLEDPADRPNALVIVRSHERTSGPLAAGGDPTTIGHDEVYSGLARRPPSYCAVATPAGEVLRFEPGQTPSRSELTSRHFVSVRVPTDRADHEVILGCLRASNDPRGARPARVCRSRSRPRLS